MQYNRQCLFCQRMYYACRMCESINSWKNSCCSPECYRNMLASLEKKAKEIEKKNSEISEVNDTLKKNDLEIDKQNIQENQEQEIYTEEIFEIDVKKKEYNLFEKTKPIVINIGKVDDMKGRLITNNKLIDIVGYDLQLGRFDDKEGKTHTWENFKDFTLTVEELKEIVKNVNN